MATHEAEAWLAEKLKQHGVDIYYDAGEFPSFRERLRAAILRYQVAHVIVGRHAGRTETYLHTFERLYGVPLIPTADTKPTRE